MRVPESRGTLSTFLAGLAGAAAMAGTLLPWAVVHLYPRFIGVELSAAEQVRNVEGVDFGIGPIVMAAGLVAALAAGAALVRRSRWLPVIASGGGVAVFALSLEKLLTLHDEVIHGSLNPYLSNPALGARRLEKLFDVSPGYGLFLTLAGGAVACVASIVAVARNRPKI